MNLAAPPLKNTQVRPYLNACVVVPSATFSQLSTWSGGRRRFASETVMPHWMRERIVCTVGAAVAAVLAIKVNAAIREKCLMPFYRHFTCVV